MSELEDKEEELGDRDNLVTWNNKLLMNRPARHITLN